MKANTLKTIGALAIGWLLFSSFKKKPMSGSVKVYDYQDNVPSGTTQVFSKIGTKVYDANFSVIYTYDTAGIGMTMTGEKGTQMFSVVIGQSFMNGIAGFVFKDDVITL